MLVLMGQPSKHLIDNRLAFLLTKGMSFLGNRPSDSVLLFDIGQYAIAKRLDPL